MSSFLEVEDLHAAYGQIKVLHGISFTANEGEITAILGANGAGKTTLLRAISGVIPASGKIMLEGQSLTGKNADRIARKMRVAHVPEGRGTFVNLKVHENLQLGAYPRRDRDEIEEDLAYVYGYFPRLKERSHQTAGHLSGGEQQMLAIARALMLRPRLMLLDEPSLGLAPLVVGDLFEIVSQINQERSTTIVIVEQNATQVLKLASWAHVLESGRAVLSGSAEELSQDEAVRRSYLGY